MLLLFQLCNFTMNFYKLFYVFYLCYILPLWDNHAIFVDFYAVLPIFTSIVTFLHYVYIVLLVYISILLHCHPERTFCILIDTTALFFFSSFCKQNSSIIRLSIQEKVAFSCATIKTMICPFQ